MAPSPPQGASPCAATGPVEVGNDNAPQRKGDFRRDEGVGFESRRLECAPCYVVNRTKGSCTKKVLSSPEELRQELKTGVETASPNLIVLHGLSVEYTRVLKAELNLEEELVGAPAGRRKYQCARGRNNATTITSFDYPELVQSATPRPPVVEPVGKVRDFGAVTDILDDPLKVTISEIGEEVHFCRTTLWEGKKGRVLFLDRSFWDHPSSFVEKRRHDEVKSFERRLWDCIDTQGPSICLSETIEALAFEQWVELIDLLQPSMRMTPNEFTALFWNIQRCLERNVDMLHRYDRSSSETSYIQPSWQSLLERTERYRRLLLDMKLFKTREQVSQTADLARIICARKKDPSEEVSKSDEGQRSLARVTYLGGILLPFSLVAGILSIADPFGPTQAMFYVYWAISVPLTVLTLLIIYADSIRRDVVWVENSVERSYRGDGSGGLWERGHSGKKANGTSAVSMPSLNQSIPYSFTDPVANLSTSQLGTDEQSLVPSEPVKMLQSKFGRGKKAGTWQRQELGWVGACKCILGVSKVQKIERLPSDGQRSSDEEV